MRIQLRVVRRELADSKAVSAQADRVPSSSGLTVRARKKMSSMLRVIFSCLICLTSLAASLSATAQDENSPLAIEHNLTRIMAAEHGSGTFSSADRIATMFNWTHMSSGFFDTMGALRPALAISSAGPLDSIANLIGNRAEFAIVRADLADAIFKQSKDPRFEGRDKLRLVSTHQPTMLHIVVRSDFMGSSIQKLNGKLVNIGGTDAATLTHVESILGSYGLDATRYTPIYAPTSEALRRLKAGTVDAVMFFDQVPSTLIFDDIENGHLKFVSISDTQPVGASTFSKLEFANVKTPYFVNVATNAYYESAESARAVMASTYLLTRRDASPDAVDSVIELLNATPLLTDHDYTNDSDWEESAQGKAQQTQKAGSELITKQPHKALMHHDPFRISPDLSPIPLHSGAQILLDIFSDPQFGDSFTEGPAEETTVNAEKGDE